jgi:hypothetical protein
MQEYYLGLAPGEEAIDRLVDGVLPDPGVRLTPAGDPAVHVSGLWGRMRQRWAVAHPDTTQDDPSRCV